MQDAMFYTRHGNCFVGKVPDNIPTLVKLEQYYGMFQYHHLNDGETFRYSEIVWPVVGVTYDFYTVR